MEKPNYKLGGEIMTDRNQSDTCWNTVEHIHAELEEAESKKEWGRCPNLRNCLVDEIYRYLKSQREEN